MTLANKIEFAESLVRRVVANYRNPVVMSSFGKDSMVMLEILKRMGLDFPVLFHREPFSPSKFRFANRMIERGNYRVYDYPPLETVVLKNRGLIEIANCYQVGGGELYLPNGVVPPEEGKPFLCGYRDLYLRPTGSFSFPWDVAFMGHKSSDVDPFFGPIPLKVDIRKNPESCDYAYPLRYFTDEDIWQYHLDFDVPVNEERYDPKKNFREVEDLTFSNDHYHTCTRCIDRDEAAEVLCPKTGQMIANISADIRYVKAELPPYIGKEPDETFAERRPRSLCS